MTTAREHLDGAWESRNGGGTYGMVLDDLLAWASDVQAEREAPDAAGEAVEPQPGDRVRVTVKSGTYEGTYIERGQEYNDHHVNVDGCDYPRRAFGSLARVEVLSRPTPPPQPAEREASTGAPEQGRCDCGHSSRSHRDNMFECEIGTCPCKGVSWPDAPPEQDEAAVEALAGYLSSVAWSNHGTRMDPRRFWHDRAGDLLAALTARRIPGFGPSVGAGEVVVVVDNALPAILFSYGLSAKQAAGVMGDLDQTISAALGDA